MSGARNLRSTHEHIMGPEDNTSARRMLLNSVSVRNQRQAQYACGTTSYLRIAA